MGRPKKLTLDFFVHSANARHDRRIRSLRRRDGNDGYATYYILLEMSCSEKEMKLHLDNEITIEDIADECGLRDIAHLYKVIESCISVGLFNSQLWRSERIIFSDDLYNSYLDRLEDRKATAERKQRFSEAKSLQEKINQVTQKTDVVTQEAEVVTRDNPPEDQKYRNTELSELQNTHTEKEFNQENMCEVVLKKVDSKISDVEKFEQKWRSPIKIDCYQLSRDLEFVDFVLKKLKNTPAARKGDWLVDASAAANHIKKGVTDLEYRGKVETYYEEFLSLKKAQETETLIAADRKKIYVPPHPREWTDEQKAWTDEDWQNYLGAKDRNENPSYA